jgi:hypothetical protein
MKVRNNGAQVIEISLRNRSFGKDIFVNKCVKKNNTKTLEIIIKSSVRLKKNAISKKLALKPKESMYPIRKFKVYVKIYNSANLLLFLSKTKSL